VRHENQGQLRVIEVDGFGIVSWKMDVCGGSMAANV
jgi:hypothetical protein